MRKIYSLKQQAFFLLLLISAALSVQSQSFSAAEVARWEKQAKNVTIIRDNWGIPHVYGKTDADAVFGLLYAQCEDDFARVELNYIEKLGRMAEVKGSSYFYEDLLIRMIIDSAETVADYNKAPAWLKKLCVAFADAVNFYMYKHPEKKPALITRFEPWYPLLWTDGSIGAISTADLTTRDLQMLYGKSDFPALAVRPDRKMKEEEGELTGSNGFAISPAKSASGNAMLYINPHVTFYFRPEVHMVSEEGLNAYGAVTWGQFFVYQGFNENCGWMHTSCYVDAADTYVEKIENGGKGMVYQYNGGVKPVVQKPITIRYTDGGGMQQRTLQALYTHHGPVMAKRNGQLLSMRADNRIMNGLIQCWQRTKAKGLDDFKKTLELYGNISNSTVFADAKGNIAYWHGNRIPARDPKFDWTKPVDGTVKATEWSGVHKVDETVHMINPVNGWLQHCNSSAFTVAGKYSLKEADFPKYMAPDGENFRGLNAVRVLAKEDKFDMDKMIAAGYDTYLTAFELLIPALVKRFEEQVKPTDSLYAYLAGPIAVLKNWDYRTGEKSIPTTLAVEWGQRIMPLIFRTKVVDDEEADVVAKARQFVVTAAANDFLQPMLATILDLQKHFGRWQLPWGEINRFQRISADIDNRFDDAQPSIPVGFVSSTWGMLPSYTSRTYPGTQKRYGMNGNSFICAVEFGPKVKAKSLLAGGNSGDPASKHFFDQSVMYSKGQFKEVLYYKEDVLKHVEKQYHPGE